MRVLRDHVTVRSMDTKVCTTCKTEKPILGNFTKNVARKDGLHHSCRDCQSNYTKQHYKNNKKYYKDKKLNYGKTIQEAITKAKSKPCMDCKIIYPPYVMDFDHRDGTKKEFNLSFGRFTGLRRVTKEMAKCDIVCANCHRIRTHNRRAGVAQLV